MQSIFIVGMGPGVSAAVARRFGREGFEVIGFARRADALRAQTQALAAAGITAHGQTTDASDPEQLRSAIEAAVAQHGLPDVLVYNAASPRYRPLAEVTPAEFAADLQAGIVGAFAAVQCVLPQMMARGHGTLLFTGGGFAFEPMPAMASLGVAKAGIRNLAFSLFAALKDTGVHAATVTICGIVKPGTPFDPDAIAQAYWTLHAQPKGSFEREVLFKP